MTKLKNKTCSMILTKKQQKSDHYYPGKLKKMNFLQVKKYYLLIKEESKFACSSLGKAFENQTKTVEKHEK